MATKKRTTLGELIEMKKQTNGLLAPDGFLQFFAGGDDDDNPGGTDDDNLDDDNPDDKDDDLDDNPGDDDKGIDSPVEYERGIIDTIMKANEIDFGKLLKDNPELKKAYQARFNKNMKDRLNKFDGVDVDKYNELVEREKNGKLEGDAETWKKKYEELEQKLEQNTKWQTVQETAIDLKLDKEQIAFVKTVIDVTKLEKDDEGEWMGVEDQIDEIREKFPRMFDSVSTDTDDDKGDKGDKKHKYNPGKGKHNGGSNGATGKEAGKQRALDRHKKK